MNDETCRVTTPHGALHAQRWTPPNAPAGQVGLIHGLGEHAGRYQAVAERLVEAGYQVLAIDQRGHGQTPGQRGHVARYEHLLDDVDAVIGQLRQDDPDVPVFLYGHSLGGGVVLNHALRRGRGVAGVIASSPLLRTTVPPPAWKVHVGKALSRVWPTFPFVAGIDPAGRSHDPQVAVEYAADPLTHDRVSARLAVEMLQAGRWALEHAADLSVPTRLLHGDADPITCHKASTDFAATAGASCDLKLWPGKLHELHWEDNRDEVLDDVVDWLHRHTESATPSASATGDGL